MNPDSAASRRPIIPPAPVRPRRSWIYVLIVIVVATVLAEIVARALDRVSPDRGCNAFGCWIVD